MNTAMAPPVSEQKRGFLFQKNLSPVNHTESFRRHHRSRISEYDRSVRDGLWKGRSGTLRMVAFRDRQREPSPT